MQDPPTTEVSAELRLYAYDPIGNRTDSTTGTASAVYYCVNDLNQYTAIDSRSACVVNPAEQLRYDADGNLTNAEMVQADFDLDGDVDMPDYYNYFSACFNGANRPPKAGCPSLATDLDGDADVDLGDYSLFQGCFNGANAPPKCNSAAPVQYTWDGGCRRK